jgi:two-component system, cell cycle response regulator
MATMALPEVPITRDHSSIQSTILIADDSPLYRRLVEQSFAETGHKIISAKNGREALKLFAEHQPELVITDWAMPDISGIELCQRIRSEFRHLYPYIVLLTGNTDKVEVIEGLAAGADDYLTKPFHSGELQARIHVGLRIVALHKEVQEKNRQLEELALTDPLTGLPNRRAVEIWASRELKAAKRHGFSVWVAIADLDYFKRVNDTYGHDRGDVVLQRFAEILKRNTRGSDICARLGGEEFLVILTHVDKQQAKTAIERLRLELEEQIFGAGRNVFGVTASFGVSALCNKDDSSLAALMNEADSVMYAAKNHGRNRVEFAEDNHAQ